MFDAIFCPAGDASLLLGVQEGWKGFSCCCCFSPIACGGRWLFGLLNLLLLPRFHFWLPSGFRWQSLIQHCWSTLPFKKTSQFRKGHVKKEEKDRRKQQEHAVTSSGRTGAGACSSLGERQNRGFGRDLAFASLPLPWGFCLHTTYLPLNLHFVHTYVHSYQ